jgi:hypothetical protein
MNVGVSTLPWAVTRRPRRARDPGSTALTEKGSNAGLTGRPNLLAITEQRKRRARRSHTAVRLAEKGDPGYSEAMDRGEKSRPGTASRDQLDTIPLDSESLGRLKSLSRIDEDVDSFLATPLVEIPESGPREPQVSVPFELTRPPAAAPHTDIRPPQVSIPFELSQSPLVEEPAPVVEPRRAPDVEIKWESVPPEPRSRLRLWLAFFVLLALLVAELAASGLGARALHELEHLAP